MVLGKEQMWLDCCAPLLKSSPCWTRVPRIFLITSRTENSLPFVDSPICLWTALPNSQGEMSDCIFFDSFPLSNYTYKLSYFRVSELEGFEQVIYRDLSFFSGQNNMTSACQNCYEMQNFLASRLMPFSYLCSVLLSPTLLCKTISSEISPLSPKKFLQKQQRESWQPCYSLLWETQPQVFEGS